MDFHQDEVEYNCLVDEVRYGCTACAFVQHDRKCFSPVTPGGDRYFIINVTGTKKVWQVPNLTLTSCTTEHILLDIIESSIEEHTSPVLLHFDIPEEVRSAMIAKISKVAKNKSNTADRIYKTLRMNVIIHIDKFSWTDDGNHDDDDDDDDDEEEYYDDDDEEEYYDDDDEEEEYYDDDEEEYYDDDDEGAEAFIEDEHQISTPASRSSIEELERVSIRGGAKEEEGSSDCIICLQDFEVGAEAIRMPCSHLFHSSCILEWLNCSNVCPLCRFGLPPADDDG